MGEKLCSSCLRNVPLDENEYIDEKYKYGPGICETCKTFSLALRQGLHLIKTNVTPHWLNMHKEDVCKALFAEIGERESQAEASSSPAPQEEG